MYKLCIFIPTRNNPTLIDFFLKTIENDVVKYQIYIYIYDTSDNNSTKEVVEKYDNLSIIYHFNEEYPDKTTDLKIIETFEKIQNQYDYIWLCGDGYVPILENSIPFIEKSINSKCDVIHFVEKDDINDRKSIAMKYLEYFGEYGWHTTLYGATIVSTDLFKEVNWFNFQNYRNTGFLYWYVLLDVLSKKNGSVFVVPRENTYIPNPYKKINSSYRPNGFARFWIQAWPEMIEQLPMEYDPYKDSVCKMLAEKLNLYSYRGLIKLRKTQNLNFKMIRQNKEKIKKVTDVSIYRFYFISLIPVVILSFLTKSFRFIKKIRRKK